MSTMRDTSRSLQQPFSYSSDVDNVTPRRVVFSPGAFAQVGVEVESLGGTRCLVISTAGRGAMAERVAALLGSRCAGIHADAKSHIPIEVVREAQGKIGALGVDCMVAIGGGAAIGLAKAIALETKIPFIVIPTTYSGSEMTGFCGITIDGVKRMHKSPDMIARTVIYDPELTLGLPLAVTVPSAMNSLAHCIDALYVSTTSPIIACAAAEGMRVIVQSLKKVLAAPGDIDARSDLLYGSYLGGAALTGGFALQHRLAQLLGGALHLPHADAHAAVLPYVVAFNASYVPRTDARIAAAFNVDDAAGGLYDFARSVGSPLGLRQLGMKESDIDRSVDIVVENDNGLNPRPLDRTGLRKLIEAAFEGQRPDSSAL
ncbi:MAG: maleylacetate reductase [Burkholderiales bacterium]